MSSGVVLPYSDGWLIKNVTFINFDRPGASVVSTTTIAGTCAKHCGGFHSKFQQITLYNATKKGRFRYGKIDFINSHIL